MSRLVAGCLLVVAGVACRASPPGQGVPAEVAYPGPPVTMLSTASGLTVGVLDVSDGERFALALALPGGTAHQEVPGTALLLATALRQVSTRLPRPTGSAVDQEADEQGVGSALDGMGVSLNVVAEPTQVVLEANGPAHRVGEAVTLVCALAFHPRLDDEALEGSRAEAMALGDERARGTPLLADDVLRAELLGGRPAGRPVLPSVADVAGWSLAHLEAFHARAARVEDAALFVAGHGGSALVDVVAAAAWPCGAGGPVSVSAAESPSVVTEPPVAGGLRRVAVVTGPGSTAHVRLGGRAPGPGTQGALALSVLVDGLANGFSSTLVRDLRGRRGLVYGVEGGVRGAAGEGWWSVGTSTAPRHVDTVVQALLGAVGQVHGEGMGEGAWRELSRAAALAFPFGRESLAEVVAMETLGWSQGWPPGAAWGQAAALWALDPVRANDVVRPLLDPRRLVLVVVGPRSCVEGRAWDRVVEAAHWPP